MRALEVTAHLVNGFAARDPWSPALDGIVAAVVMQQRLGADYAVSGAVASALRPVEGLPFEVCRLGALWWYAASAPLLHGFAGRERRAFHRRFDDQHERYIAGKIGRVTTSAGPYKAVRLSDQRTLCRAVSWHVVGDEEAIMAALAEVDQVGARRGIGYGRVARWSVGPGDADLARYHRPLPAEHERAAGRAVVPWGLVPPARDDRVDCGMPEARDAGG